MRSLATLALIAVNASAQDTFNCSDPCSSDSNTDTFWNCVTWRWGNCLQDWQDSTSIVSAQSAQSGMKCDPKQIGELRVWSDKTKCLTVNGDYVESDWCENLKEQLFYQCTDGTIRIMPSNFCLTADDDEVVVQPCQYYPYIPDTQKWEFYTQREGTKLDAGIAQTLYMVYSVSYSNYCMQVDDGDDELRLSNDCHNLKNLNDQSLYFKNRGKSLGHGRLYNAANQQCADNEVDEVKCNNEDLNQFWTFYENGEFINSGDGLCMDVGGYDGEGWVKTYECINHPSQQWIQYCGTGDDGCFYINKQDNSYCLDAYAKDGQLYSQACDYSQTQLFKFMGSDWINPAAKWKYVGCNQSGDLKRTVGLSTSWSHTLTSTTSVEVAAEMEAGVVFSKAKTTVTVSQSIANAWTDTYSLSDSVEYTCNQYQDGTKFTRGCMWQLQVTVKNTHEMDNLVWNAGLVACTKDDTPPQCPPFQKCSDSACSTCIDM